MSVISVSRRPASTAQEQNQEEIPSSAIDREPFRKPVPLGASATQHFSDHDRRVSAAGRFPEDLLAKLPGEGAPTATSLTSYDPRDGGGVPGSRLDGGVEN